eukprot:CAMPEP_0175333872 /NCGR_PEP_ID=MMETSP0095-20121207/2505_1 /TAXON_ID=311494 /ORGANISM="Alexandrium monilatum, Strain CCMP3105" /LENGTH=522 /DNA_ID=CAMNT_0016631181 /DNA_START=1 /DNA_END=1566 /DNA_ORIENTATION=+
MGAALDGTGPGRVRPLADQRSAPLMPNHGCQARELTTPAPGRGKSNFIAVVGNFSIQYNFVSASIALQVLTSSDYLGQPLYPEPAWSSDVTLAAVFLGAMVGMVCMGRLGDVMGRSRALRATMTLAAVGAVVPACAFGPPNLAYSILCAGRLLLGVGVGGIFPLSAVHAAEGSSSDQSRGSRVTWAFFWQSPGQCMPYLVAMLLFWLVRPEPAQRWAPELQFRLLFALGVIPGVLAIVASMREEESAEFQGLVQRRQQQPQMGVVAALRAEPAETRWTLLGTAGTWFFYDICFYGSATFTPDILDSICISGTKHDGMCDQTLFQTAWQGLVVQAMSMPGCLLAILLINRIGSKRLNVIGLLLLCVNFAAMAVVSAVDRNAEATLFALFCMLTFLLNFGPNVGTYVLPAICFPAHVRSTCHGLSSFGGKAGAALGALVFPAVKATRLGIPGVMAIQAIFALIGAAVSQTLLKHDWDYLGPEDKCATQSFVEGAVAREACPACLAGVCAIGVPAPTLPLLSPSS